MKQRSHVRNVKLTCKRFLAIVCNSYDWSKPNNTIKIPLNKQIYRETTAPYLEQPGHHFALTKNSTSCTRNKLGSTGDSI